MDLIYIKLIYVAVGFVATALNSYINWRSNAPEEPFNLAKFLSAYIRTAWALIPTALLFAENIGLTLEGLLSIAAIALGVDDLILASRKLGKMSATAKNS